MRDTEIEIQVKIENSQDLLNFLEKKARFISKKHQIDEYFTPSHRNFIGIRPAKEWLRLRNSDGKFSITYKNWHHDKDGKSHYCDEYETEIAKIDQLKKIFTALDFKLLVIVEKTRKTWVYHHYEISLDSVRKLGDYVEIEYQGHDKKVKPEEITGKMISFLKKLKCGKIERNYLGYPFQLLFPNEVKHEEQ
ncbi:MAG TPA: class IV adenylate cyclase [Candidatus Bathyarchaeia archaeon]|nr:class IV adenylate cyclase [Candidatus Bathyarchaeia archaeon]